MSYVIPRLLRQETCASRATRIGGASERQQTVVTRAGIALRGAAPAAMPSRGHVNPRRGISVSSRLRTRAARSPRQVARGVRQREHDQAVSQAERVRQPRRRTTVPVARARSMSWQRADISTKSRTPMLRVHLTAALASAAAADTSSAGTSSNSSSGFLSITAAAIPQTPSANDSSKRMMVRSTTERRRLRNTRARGSAWNSSRMKNCRTIARFAVVLNGEPFIEEQGLAGGDGVLADLDVFAGDPPRVEATEPIEEGARHHQIGAIERVGQPAWRKAHPLPRASDPAGLCRSQYRPSRNLTIRAVAVAIGKVANRVEPGLARVGIRVEKCEPPAARDLDARVARRRGVEWGPIEAADAVTVTARDRAVDAAVGDDDDFGGAGARQISDQRGEQPFQVVRVVVSRNDDAQHDLFGTTTGGDGAARHPVGPFQFFQFAVIPAAPSTRLRPLCGSLRESCSRCA